MGGAEILNKVLNWLTLILVEIDMDGSGIGVWQLMILLVVLPLFFLPSIVAISRNHPHKIFIVVVNIIGGFAWGVGWLIALIWSLIIPKKMTNPIPTSADEIERLHALKVRGVITQEEFDIKKRSLLGIKDDCDIYSR